MRKISIKISNKMSIKIFEYIRRKHSIKRKYSIENTEELIENRDILSFYNSAYLIIYIDYTICLMSLI